jgi:hypothetical protein
VCSECHVGRAEQSGDNERFGWCSCAQRFSVLALCRHMCVCVCEILIKCTHHDPLRLFCLPGTMLLDEFHSENIQNEASERETWPAESSVEREEASHTSKRLQIVRAEQSGVAVMRSGRLYNKRRGGENRKCFEHEARVVCVKEVAGGCRFRFGSAESAEAPAV